MSQMSVSLRAEKAFLLGKPDFADLTLERRMAGSGARALDFIADMQGHAGSAFVRECRELEEFKAQQTGVAAEPLAPWEVGNMIERAYVGLGGTHVIHFIGTTPMAAPEVCVPRQFTSRRKVQLDHSRK